MPGIDSCPVHGCAFCATPVGGLERAYFNLGQTASRVVSAIEIEGTEQTVSQVGNRLVCSECDRDPQTDHGNGD